MLRDPEAGGRRTWSFIDMRSVHSTASKPRLHVPREQGNVDAGFAEADQVFDDTTPCR